ncbi:MAG: MATE family efflux transporter [Clostridia bacterium]|nr:MATE family efflux transporter [Clostridia bacterium]
MENTRTQNKMGYLPVPGLILKMSLPMMVSMLVLATYNVVDSIFVSRISENALTAVSLVFPFQMIITAVAVGTAAGANSLIARRLGAQDQDSADRAAANGIFLSVVSGLFFFVFFLLLTPALIGIFKPDAEITDYAITYLSWVGIPAIFACVQVMEEKILQATGNTIHSMLIQLIGAVFNLIFDPILIFGLLGFPALGVAGAAIATVGGQMVGMIFGAFLIFSKKCLVKVNFKRFRPSLRTIKDIYVVGIPSIFLQMVGSVMNVGINKILIAFTPTAVSVMGVYFKLQSFVFMPVFGLNSGTMPIIGYNFGARNRKRVMDALKYGSLYAFCVMMLGLLLFQSCAPFMLNLFDASPAMLEIGVPALKTISLCFPMAALGIMFSSLFQAIGNGRLSLLMSALRQLIILLPAAFIFSKIWGLSAVWYAFPVAEIFALIFASIMLVKVYNAQIRYLEG